MWVGCLVGLAQDGLSLVYGRSVDDGRDDGGLIEGCGSLAERIVAEYDEVGGRADGQAPEVVLIKHPRRAEGVGGYGLGESEPLLRPAQRDVLAFGRAVNPDTDAVQGVCAGNWPVATARESHLRIAELTEGVLA